MKSKCAWLTNWQSDCLGTGIDIPSGRKIFKTHNTMLKPLGTRVVLEPKEAETMTAGGLYIPDNAKEKPQQGVVRLKIILFLKE